MSELTQNGILIAAVVHALIGVSLVWDKVLPKRRETKNLLSYVFWLGATERSLAGGRASTPTTLAEKDGCNRRNQRARHRVLPSTDVVGNLDREGSELRFVLKAQCGDWKNGQNHIRIGLLHALRLIHILIHIMIRKRWNRIHLCS